MDRGIDSESFDKHWDRYMFRGLPSFEPYANGNQLAAAGAAVIQDASLFAWSEFEIQLRREIESRWMIVPGLLSRHPVDEKIENTRVDDYLLACCVHWHIANSICDYGKKTSWTFDVNRPGRFSQDAKTWMFRHFGFVAHAKFCAFRKPNFLLRMAWAISMILSTHKSRDVEDAWIQSHAMAFSYRNNRSCAGRSIVCDFALAYWTARYKKGARIGEIYANYTMNPDHPLTMYWTAKS
jgi:hypothetical protein